MVKIIDLMGEEKNREKAKKNLVVFIEAEFKRESPDVSVKIRRHRGEAVEMWVVAGEGRNKEKVLNINLEEDVGNAWLGSIDVLDRMYYYTARKVAEKYEKESEDKGIKREVTLYLR